MGGWKSELRHFGRLEVVELQHLNLFLLCSPPKNHADSENHALQSCIDGDGSQSGNLFSQWIRDFH